MKNSKLVFINIFILFFGVLFFCNIKEVYSSDFDVIFKENEKNVDSKEQLEIESLSNYIDIYSTVEYNNLAQEIYSITDFIVKDYPEHKKWFFEKHLPGVKSGLREVFFVRNDSNSVIAVCFVKKSEVEKKICTLYVSPEFGKRGIGTLLIDKAIEFLGTKTPLITFSEHKKPMFESIIKKYDWKLTEKIDACYNDEYTELCYNGKLIKDKND